MSSLLTQEAVFFERLFDGETLGQVRGSGAGIQAPRQGGGALRDFREKALAVEGGWLLSMEGLGGRLVAESTPRPEAVQRDDHAGALGLEAPGIEDAERLEPTAVLAVLTLERSVVLRVARRPMEREDMVAPEHFCDLGGLVHARTVRSPHQRGASQSEVTLDGLSDGSPGVRASDGEARAIRHGEVAGDQREPGAVGRRDLKLIEAAEGSGVDDLQT